MPTQPVQVVRDPDETMDLERLISEVVPDPDSWKVTPNSAFGGERPIDLLHTPKAAILRDVLRAAKQGMTS